jgi:DNA processing protein
LEAEADRLRGRVAEALGPAPVDVDELIRQMGAPPSVILTILLEFELGGRLARYPGNRVAWA